MTTYLVSCVKGKLTGPAPAGDLYQSLWFCAARAFVEKQNAAWFILSAKYGLVSPDRIVAPYEMTLNRSTSGERRVGRNRSRNKSESRSRLVSFPFWRAKIIVNF
jgi:hypothetical protein